MAEKKITNYEKLFGTPERAAEVLRGSCRFCSREGKACYYGDNACTDGITEFLNQEATNEQI